jgi:flagellar motor switch protein FliM
MAQILSEEEVEGFINAKTEPPKNPEGDQSGVIPYDLSSQDRIIRGRMPTLEIIADRLVRMFRITISAALRRPVDVSVRSHKLMKFGDFLETIKVPSALSLYRMNPLRGTCIHVIEPDLIYKLVDLFYGGTGDLKVETEGKDFTVIETILVKRLVISFLADMEIAWRPVFPVQMAFQRIEINPQFVAIVPASEVVLVVTIVMDFGSQGEEDIRLCIPYSMIEPIRPLLDSGFQRIELNNPGWEDRLASNLNTTKVKLTAKTDGKDLTVTQFIDLKEGDVLLSDQKMDQPIDIYMNGIRKMTGVLKEEQGRQTVKVAEIFEAQVYNKIEELKQKALELRGEK